jgi:NADH-quinone oxidoreductase subunit F
MGTTKEDPMPETWRLLAPEQITSLDEHVAHGGGAGLVGARHVGPDETIAVIAASGLRGRGGAGFPTATKWRSVAHGGPGTRYVVANGAEGEPGTFKDRALLRTNPYLVVEGLLIAAEAVGARQVHLALKASFEAERERVVRVLAEVRAAGWLDDVEVRLVSGPEEYLFGEEKALLEVIEGREPLPRWLPPYLHGLFTTGPQLGWQASETADQDETGANPTSVNNVETLAQAAWVMIHGADAYRSVGTEGTPGTVLCTVVGDADRPGVREVAAGTPLRTVLDAAGAPRPGRRVKAVVPGVSNAVLTGDLLDTPLCFDAMAAVGSGLGAAGFVVYDDTACMVEVAAVLSRFLAVESCGQCPPCKLGTGQITAALERIRTGVGDDGDLGRIEENLRIVADGNRCYIPVQERVMISSLLRAFPSDVAAHLEGRCPADRAVVPTPKILDLVDGVVTYDPRQELKRPDWTYGDPTGG